MEELVRKEVGLVCTLDFEEACLRLSRGFELAEIADWGSRDFPISYSPAFYFYPYPNLEKTIYNRRQYKTVCRRHLFNLLKVKVPGVSKLKFKDSEGWYEIDASSAFYSKKKIKRNL